MVGDNQRDMLILLWIDGIFRSHEKEIRLGFDGSDRIGSCVCQQLKKPNS